MSKDDDWFHGALSREDAQRILNEESQRTGINGIFLVRESLTLPNSYVLSVIFNKEYFHYQIQQHGEDAFFSIDSQCIQHGIDFLIDHYRRENSNLCTKLDYFVRKMSPPTNICRSGKANLLHRATKANNLNVVKEILNSNSSYRNFDAKDEHGMTAVHIAAINKVNPEILKLLIEKGAAVNSRDSQGNTAFHYACRYNSVEMVKLFLAHNINLLHARNNETGLVPLHEAAKAGSLEIVKILLDHKAACMPRSCTGELPSDYARENNHIAVAEFLENYVPPINTFSHKWHHGTLGREDARTLLLEKRNELYEEYAKDESAYVNDSKEINELISGLFLVRSSERNRGLDVITMLHDDDEFKNIRNYVIHKFNKFLYIDDGPYMHSLEHLISYYMTFADGLPVKLSKIVEPIPKPPIPIPTLPRNKHKTPHVTKVSSSPQISSPTTSSSVDSIPNESSPNKQKSQSVFNIFTKKKKLSLPTSDKTPETSTAALSDKLKTISFSTDFLNNNNLSSPSGESYDVPPPPRKSTQDLTTYFTESDKNAWESSGMKDNCIEEIYFVDPPLNTRQQDGASWGHVELDPELYDTRKNILKEVNQKTGANYYVSKEELKLEREIGSGEFGNVLRGIMRLPDGGKLWVAVKTLHKEHYQDNLGEFLREASVMIKLDNQYIVKLIGITKGPPVALVQELCPLGSLANYLTNHASEIENKDINLWASQIAQGMEYLESKRFVHRDLASRNILLATKEHCKISDFGLSRAVGVDKDFYQSFTGGRWPLKWYAPESFYGKFSHASDVWSFGITLWELYSKGQTPYGDLSGSEVNELIEKGHRLSRPEGCPEDIYRLMLDCWHHRDRLRPNFQFLAKFFTNRHLSHLNANVPDETSSDESEKHSNTVYV